MTEQAPARPRMAAVLQSRGASRFVERRSRKFADLLRRSGTTGNPVVMAADSVTDAVKGALVATPLALAAALLVSPFLVFLAAVPVVFIAVPELRLRDRIAERREGVERELPFFSMFVSVLGGAGMSLYAALRELAESDVFPHTALEARQVRRDVEIFGINPNEALERLASDHPSRRFRDFLTGYTSKARSGGDVAAYLSSEGGAFLRGLENEWARYSARVGIVGSMMITVFGVVPLLLMVVGVFSPGFSMVGLLFFAAVGVPLFTVGLLYLAGRMQPVHEATAKGKAARCLALASPGLAAGYLLGEYWLGAAGFLLVFFTAYGLGVRRQLTEDVAVERGFSLFLKDLLEYKRQDYDLARAVVAIQSSNRYNRHFDSMLARVAAKLKAGIPLDEVRVECRNRLGKLTFLLLGEMSRSGGGTVETVYQVSSFSEKTSEMRQNAASEMKPYLVLSYVSPLLLAFGITFVGGVLSSFGAKAGAGLAMFRSFGAGATSLPPNMGQLSDLLIVVSAAALGLIGAKLTDFTARNTLKASLNVGLAVGAISLMALLSSHSLGLALGR